MDNQDGEYITLLKQHAEQGTPVLFEQTQSSMLVREATLDHPDESDTLSEQTGYAERDRDAIPYLDDCPKPVPVLSGIFDEFIKRMVSL